MKPEDIAPIAPPGQNINQHPDRNFTARKSIKPSPSVKDNAGVVHTSSHDRIKLSNLETSNFESQQLAKQIRQVDQSMETINSHLSQMRETLTQIVKMFPPYPPDSSERIEALRQVSSIRKMIDQLATPDLTAGLQNIMASAGKAEGTSVEQTRPGQFGFDIPEIPADASDQQITDALDKTVAAQKILNARRQSFVANASHIISQFS